MMVTECVNRAAKAMAAKKDAVIRKAVNDRLGDDWSFEGLADRLESVTSQHFGVETFYLDDKPLVEFYPAEPTHDYRDYSHYVGFNRKYRIFHEDVQP